MKPNLNKLLLLSMLGVLWLGRPAAAQFRDDFNGPLKRDPEGLNGWSVLAGEGKATIDLKQGAGFASILVDATKDSRDVWWALMKRAVSGALDLSRLRDPGWALRVEARIRVSDAPRRVNLHFNTQRTTDFHSHLMEYDIPDAETWHTISMTTHGFDARPGDTVNAQMALMDWGTGRYRVDVDYFKVDVVNTAQAGPDLGDPVPYHPSVADPGSFSHTIPALEDGMIDLQNPDVNFKNWFVRGDGPRTEVLTVSGSQVVILRWDLSALAGKKAAGAGLLEMTTKLVERTSDDLPDFGQVRVVEIIGGDSRWTRAAVTANSLYQGRPADLVLVPQMIIDWPVTEGDGGKTYFTISRPSLQRLIDGKTLGLAIRSLGAINASFYTKGDRAGKTAPRLLINTVK
jgi:hypothetical protein